MDAADKPSSGYALGPPWLFKGRALYQLHLVRAETARPFIPKELKLVQFFGYTLGGFFLAHYDESPAGTFDELVVIAGIVWNPPTSCAWAARVLVNSNDACSHGQKEIGLPSHVAMFSKKAQMMTERARNKHNGFLNIFGMATALPTLKEHCEIQVSEINNASLTQLCSISMPVVGVRRRTLNYHWLSYRSYIHELGDGSAKVKTKPRVDGSHDTVRTVEPARLSGPPKRDANEDCDDVSIKTGSLGMKKHEEDETWRQSISVLLSKPILALEFNHLKMQVEAPTIVVSSSTENK